LITLPRTVRVWAYGCPTDLRKGYNGLVEMIDVVELKYQVVEVERKKYVCGCGGTVETAPGPARAVEGGRYSLRFAIKVAFDKYVAHLPLERQTRLMAHHGLHVTSQTLWDQCSAVTTLLEPTYDAIFTRLRASPVIGVDQTGWPDLEDASLPPWQMWYVSVPGIVCHRICDDKSARASASFAAAVGVSTVALAMRVAGRERRSYVVLRPRSRRGSTCWRAGRCWGSPRTGSATGCYPLHMGSARLLSSPHSHCAGGSSLRNSCASC
jgi:transposase